MRSGCGHLAGWEFICRREWTSFLSFLLFGVLTIGQAVKFKRAIKTHTIHDKYQDISFRLISWRTFFCIVTLIVVVGCMTVTVLYTVIMICLSRSPIGWRRIHLVL